MWKMLSPYLPKRMRDILMRFMDYPHLFSSGRIGTLELPNRILMGSMHLGYEGRPGGTEQMAEFYAARARGGAALIITGGCAINEEAIGGANFSCIYKPEDLEALRCVTKRAHEDGGRIGLQLFHAGRYATKEWLSGLQPVAPSPVRSSLHPTTPREMTEHEIKKTVQDFANAAAHAQEAGFDAVEIMGSEGYLINQFLSPFINRRKDNWGGSLENRVRFGVEVMRAIRSHCGPDFPVIYRMSGIDLMPESSSWEDTIFFARQIEEAGADALNIGIGWHESRIPTISMLVPRAYYSFVVERIKKHVRIPCICSNRVNDPDVAEEVIASGRADYVSMARALLADPELPQKAKTGRSAAINTCIACNQACLDNAFRNEPTACILNPEAGREASMRIRPAEFRKKIAVVGAGPAGLEAARVLGQRGHQVTLFEKQNRIGGQLLFAVQVPGKEEFLNTIRFYDYCIKELHVRLEPGVDVSGHDLTGYDAVILATGAKPNLPAIPGIDREICLNYEYFFQNQPAGKNIVILGAGGIGCDIAHILSDAGGSYPPPSFFDDPGNVRNYENYIRSIPRLRNIALMRRGKRIGEKLGPTTRWALLQLLENRGVQMFTQIQCEAILENGVKLRSRTGKEVFLPADRVVIAAGQIPDYTLFPLLPSHVEQCFRIGAANQASETNAESAILEAAILARSL